MLGKGHRVVAHSTVGMSIVKQSRKRLGTGITRINGTSNMKQEKLVTDTPFLDGKMLDINMASTGRVSLTIAMAA